MNKRTHIGTHGRVFEGTVISSKMQKTVTIEWNLTRKVPKYERFEKKRSRIKAHNPDHIAAEKGDLVKVQECRPLSKTKNFIIIEKVGKDTTYMQNEEHMQDAKFKRTRKEEVNREKVTGEPDESNQSEN